MITPMVCDRNAMEVAIVEFLRAAGLEHYASGPAPGKTAEAWCDHLLAGYGQDPQLALQPTWEQEGGELVAMRGVAFVSVCAHHLLPFFGVAHVGYVPDGRLAGLSRIEMLIDCLARRLQVQETLGVEIATALMAGVGASGAACILEAEHLCVFARGRRQRGALAQTLSWQGVFRDDVELRNRFLSLVHAD